MYELNSFPSPMLKEAEVVGTAGMQVYIIWGPHQFSPIRLFWQGYNYKEPAFYFRMEHLFSFFFLWYVFTHASYFISMCLPKYACFLVICQMRASSFNWLHFMLYLRFSFIIGYRNKLKIISLSTWCRRNDLFVILPSLILSYIGCHHNQNLQVIAFFLRPDIDSKIRKYWNWYHHWVGRLLLFFAAINIAFGIRVGDAGNSWKVGYGINLSVLLIAVIVLETMLWTKWSKKTVAPPTF